MPTEKQPVDDAPAIPGAFGVDADPYTEDDSLGAGDESDQEREAEQ